ncbi:hypothetical protein [Desulforamulus reducens]|uniref:hypothetical protein n=1 Tax=Desulforamulus reducens TaxID=59610 RepID=UPI0012EAF39B|nr:hypothetical protein [Desulforamulus reducens]
MLPFLSSDRGGAWFRPLAAFHARLTISCEDGTWHRLASLSLKPPDPKGKHTNKKPPGALVK